MVDSREARFLASQAERLAGKNNKKQQSTNNNCKINDSSPDFVNEDNNATNAIDNTSTKAQSNQFFTNFRKINFLNDIITHLKSIHKFDI